MRSRTIREGSVGLLILLGLGLLGGLILWIRGFSPNRRSYTTTVEFPTVSGIQQGSVVRYRGVDVGRTSAIRAGVNGVEVDLEISPATVIIPQNSTIAVYQTGLAGESVVEIEPRVILPEALIAELNPLAEDCDPTLIICNGSRLQGEAGVSFNQLIAATTRFADVFSDPVFFAELRELTRNSASAAAGVAQLTGEVTTLTQAVQQELGTVSSAATASALSIAQAADQAALTAAQVNSLLTENRSALVTTLNNINQTSLEVQNIVNRLAPTIEEGELLNNLQTLSANAALASDTLLSLTQAVGTTDNLLLLQQTLDSARATFQNAQKITADLDELTGDPTFRQNIRELVNGLSGLVSSTQDLQQQAAIAQMLEPTAATFAINLTEIEELEAESRRQAEGRGQQTEAEESVELSPDRAISPSPNPRSPEPSAVP